VPLAAGYLKLWARRQGLEERCVQVFQLSILPGTEFRHEAARHGLEYQPRPPYYVLRTPALSLDDLVRLQEEAEEIFGVEFDPEPPPALERAENTLRVDLDVEEAPPLPPAPPLAFTLRFRSRNLYARLSRATRMIRELLARNPFTTLQIVLETAEVFPFDVFDAVKKACMRPENIYLDRFYEFTPRSRLGARRLVTLLPAARRTEIDPDWVEAAAVHAAVVWTEPERLRPAVP
jgi:hypothetical protein